MCASIATEKSSYLQGFFDNIQELISTAYCNYIVNMNLKDLNNLVAPEGGWLADLAQQRLKKSSSLPPNLNTALNNEQKYQAFIERMQKNPQAAMVFLIALDLPAWSENYVTDVEQNFDPVPFALRNLEAILHSLQKHTYS